MEKLKLQEKLTPEPPKLLFSARLTFFLMVLFVMFTSMLQRLNINFALVCMVKSVSTNVTNLLELDYDETATNYSLQTNHSSLLSNENTDEVSCKPSSSLNQSHTVNPLEGEFEWDKAIQANILGSFFYGFITTQILGGWLADKFGGKQMYIGSILVLSVLTLLNPIAAMQGPEFLFLVRLLMGLSHGAVLPLVNVLGIRWAGQTERAFLLSIGYFGFSFSAFITYPICAFICARLGWQYIFYVTGGTGIIWCIFAEFLIFDWPQSHPRISPEELQYLKLAAASQKDTSKANKKLRIPLRSILLSGPVNVVHITHFCGIWSMITIAISIPAFLKEVLFLDINKNGIYSSLPFLGMLILHMGVGVLFDYIRAKGVLSVTNLRKIFNTLGFWIPAISLCFVGFLPCTNNLPGFIAISAGIAVSQLALMGGYFLSIFELAPRYSGFLTGITNTCGVLPGFLCPIIVGILTQNRSREEWLRVFYLCGGINAFGGLIYLLFGSSKLQPWAVPKPRVAKENKAVEEKLIANVA